MTEQRTGGANPELLELALELAPAGMLAVDVAGTILLVNREIERLFDYPRSALIGQNVDMLLPEEARHGHPASRQRYFAAPESRPMGTGRDLYGRRSDGSRVPVEVGLNPVDTPRGKVVLASVVDITTRRNTEAQLRQAQKQEAIGTLASGIAHDFNNILLGITGYTEFLLRGNALTGGRARSDLEAVMQAAERGRKLVERLLTFSRQTDVERGPMDPTPVVNEALGLVRAMIPANIEIRTSFDPRTPALVSHETLLHQVAVNLATNAAHAMPEGGTLEVCLAPHHVAKAEGSPLAAGLYARLTVTDDGVGMSNDVLGRVMEPFYTTKPQGEGTGLGLAVIHGIVETHGGHLHIESQEGRGTRVDVYLPAHLPRGRAHDEPDGAKHVLLVEDEAALLQMLRRHLDSFGYRVSAHHSSVEALEVFKARPDDFDLLLTDNSMPKLTGVELARQVSATRPGLPILLVSGFAPPREELGQYGIRRMLAKPCSIDELEKTLAEMLADAPSPRGD